MFHVACEAGYFGEDCTSSCPPQLYGSGCTKTCTCSHCHPVFGCDARNGKECRYISSDLNLARYILTF